ncbi:MAG TPA: hypothetical protein VMU81_14295 [Acetobacteraceae bacterium]|jgi:hypothetical protein|nr:hypothetical protein [Acetobacteraceae bacterium]
MLPNTQTSRDWSPTAELAALQASLAAVDDTKIPKLLRVIDAVEHRGATDALVAPFRARMAQLQPARPLQLARLLFLPLNPLIVPSAAWEAKAPTIPRSTLVPMVDAIRDAMGKDASTVDRMVAGRTTHDHRVIAEAGPILWSAAAQALPTAATPLRWTESSGLPVELFATIAGNTAEVFAQVLRLQTWRAEAETGTAVRTSAMQNMLMEVCRRRPEGLTMVIALLLARLPQAAGVLRRAILEIGGTAAVAIRAAMDAALLNLVERLVAPSGIETAVLATHLRESGAEVYRLTRLLASATTDDATGAWRRRLSGLRQRLDGSCRLRFTLGLQTDFLQILKDPSIQPDAGLLNRLEEAARGLRELADEATQIGSAALYAELLREATEAIKAVGSDGNFTLADRVRLVEILAGPDEAWTLLEAPT